MRAKQDTQKATLRSFLGQSMGWLGVSVAILLASNRAFALNKNPSPTTSHPQLPQNIILAEDIEKESTSSEPRANSERKSTQEPRFTCQLVEGQYTVMYHPESQPTQAYPWAIPSALGGGWTPERRCNEISRRLEFYRPDGLLEMRNAVENNYNIVCVTTQKDSSCRIILTVPPGQDPEITRNRVFQNLTIADKGEQTNAVNTFVDQDGNSQLLNQVLNQGLSALGIDPNSTQSSRRNSGINLRPFLDPADGGTGIMLRRGSQIQPSPRLNPDRFR